ncbi:MAG: DNA translocase FtsK 4TM domain-containing protein, partial [Rhodospirillales bacterium]|nr:DNA translocase FtsK 4TM domain-containing protein [Rhodospirillales bacterium]
MARLLIISPGAVLPDGVRAWLSRRLRELSGIAMIACCGVVLTALLSFDIGDPSWNHATDAAVRNLLGRSGAYAADAMLQVAGLAILVPVVAFTLWGWRLIDKRAITRPFLRVLAMIGATAMTATGLAVLPLFAEWPFATGIGGLLGFVLIQGVGKLGILIHPTLATPLLAVCCFGAGMALCVYSLGVSRSEWRSLARTMTETWLAAVALYQWTREQVRRRSSFTDRREPSLGPSTAPVRNGQVDIAVDLIDPSNEPRSNRIRDPQDLIAPKSPRMAKGRHAEE